MVCYRIVVPYASEYQTFLASAAGRLNMGEPFLGDYNSVLPAPLEQKGLSEAGPTGYQSNPPVPLILISSERNQLFRSKLVVLKLMGLTWLIFQC